VTLEHGVLTHRRGVTTGSADARVAVARSALNELFSETATIDDLVSSGRLTVEGDQGKLSELPLKSQPARNWVAASRPDL